MTERRLPRRAKHPARNDICKGHQTTNSEGTIPKIRRDEADGVHIRERFDNISVCFFRHWIGAPAGAAIGNDVSLLP